LDFIHFTERLVFSKERSDNDQPFVFVQISEILVDGPCQRSEGGITQFSCWLNDSCFQVRDTEDRQDKTRLAAKVQLERMQVAKTDTELCNLEKNGDWGWLGRIRM